MMEWCIPCLTVAFTSTMEAIDQGDPALHLSDSEGCHSDGYWQHR